MENNNLANKKHWEEGYENLDLFSMDRNYPLVELIYKYFDIKNTQERSVFELGYYPGRFLYHFGKLGYELNGIDQSDYLPRMEEWYHRENFQIGYFNKEDMYDFKPAVKFDVVFSSGFIEHFTNFEEVIRLHTTWVKDGGLIYITAPNFAGLFQRILHFLLDYKSFKVHYLPAMNPQKWKKSLEEEGCEIVDYGYIGGFDFWTSGSGNRYFDFVIAKMLRNMRLPWRSIPNSWAYSPEIFIVARKKNHE